MNIFLFCYNEELMLPHTVAYYKEKFPNATITIMDNESTDRSVELAKSMGCHVVSFSSMNIMNEFVLREKRNSCFIDVLEGWVIVADMDEFLEVSMEDLQQEETNGTTILKTIGYDMIGGSKTKDLSDILPLDSLVLGTTWYGGDKRLCFRRPDITAMNYCYGGHKCSPTGNIVYSSKTYLIKHMSFLGEGIVVEKYRQRFERTHEMRNYGMDGHYSNDSERVRSMYREKEAARRNVYDMMNEDCK